MLARPLSWFHQSSVEVGYRVAPLRALVHAHGDRAYCSRPRPRGARTDSHTAPVSDPPRQGGPSGRLDRTGRHSSRSTSERHPAAFGHVALYSEHRIAHTTSRAKALGRVRETRVPYWAARLAAQPTGTCQQPRPPKPPYAAQPPDLPLGHESFVVTRPLTPLGNTFDPILALRLDAMLHARSPSCSCASLRSLRSTHKETCNRRSAPILAAQIRKRAAPGSPFLLASQGLNRAISSRRPP